MVTEKVGVVSGVVNKVVSQQNINCFFINHTTKVVNDSGCGQLISECGL